METIGMYYDRAGLPIDMHEWGSLHRNMNYKVVAKTCIASWEISTVWLGIDHRFTDDGPPMIFETMIFKPDDKTGRTTLEDVYCRRYSTEREALFGHAVALQWLLCRFSQGEDDGREEVQ